MFDLTFVTTYTFNEDVLREKFAGYLDPMPSTEDEWKEFLLDTDCNFELLRECATQIDLECTD